VKNTSQARLSTARHEKEFASLRDFSARVGSDPLLVQASNGNTSIKLDGILWIKASGKWLAHAMQEEMFVPLELARVKESIQNDAEIASPYASNGQLRPSIETAMHAVLRHRVALHVHSVNAIAWAIRLDGPDRLTERLAGLHWQWIPYAASGKPLAREIEKVVACRPETDVLILGNHGLVVGGPDCRTAEKLLCEVERRLAISPRRFPKPDTTVLAMIARFSRWQFPDVDLLHALGTDAASRKILRGGVLYPCQAIFLGPTMPLLPPTAVISKFTERWNAGRRNSGLCGRGTKRSDAQREDDQRGARYLAWPSASDATNRRSARLRYLKEAEVMGVLSQNTHCYKEVLVTNSGSEITKIDWQRKTIYKRNETHRKSSSSGRHRQHNRGG
jgi:rhamnose utilization protein RhaD (predicted bifunctional aldolase and dehydrogenase)